MDVEQEGVQGGWRMTTRQQQVRFYHLLSKYTISIGIIWRTEGPTPEDSRPTDIGTRESRSFCWEMTEKFRMVADAEILTFFDVAVFGLDRQRERKETDNDQAQNPHSA